MDSYRAPPWLPGGNAQTIWPALFARRFEGAPPRFERERWATRDNDFIDVDWQMSAPGDEAPLLVLFHGLEGSSGSHYAQAFAHWARSHGWRFAVPHFRGCSGELNLAPRAYHSGDYEEVGWMLSQLRERHDVVVRADIAAALRHFAYPRVAIAVLGHVDLELRRSAAHERTARIDPRPQAGRCQRAMQNRRVGGIDPTFEGLQPVALLDDF